jgi:hypothetical protein
VEGDVTVDHLRFAAYGLAAGLIIGAVFVLLAWWRRRELQQEIRRLREHLHTQLEISSEGNAERRRQLEQLRQENENLRVTVRAWQQKPNRHELRSLQVYDMAVHRLLESTPGFSLAWEAALKEAESRMQDSDRGIVAFTRRFISSRGDRQVLPENETKPTDEPEK